MDETLKGKELAMIWLLGLALTPLMPALLYYAWKDSHPQKAKTANRIGWVSFLIWSAGYLGYKLLVDGNGV